MNLSDAGEIRALLQQNGFNFSKQLGQNFLIDPEVCPRMAEEAIPDESYGVLEIGPGIGCSPFWTRPSPTTTTLSWYTATS